jgi:hypothetical protein
MIILANIILSLVVVAVIVGLLSRAILTSHPQH